MSFSNIKQNTINSNNNTDANTNKLKTICVESFNILTTSKEFPQSEKINFGINYSDKLEKVESFCFNLGKDINFRILVVEDERLIRNTMKKFISKFAEEKKLNIETTVCENGFEGLDYVYRGCLNKKNFNLIICDETMPYMKGSIMINTLVKLIKEETIKKMLIVSYTSYNDVDKMNYILSQGADMIKNKPISYANFKNLLEDAMKEDH